MGLVNGRAQPVQGFEFASSVDVKKVRELFQQFEDVCPTPTLWERAFHELLDCFPSPEASAVAFAVLDTDNDGLVDAREMFGALAVMCKGHLRDRLSLLFEMFDLNKENDIGFDEAFLMLRRTTGGLRKMTGLIAPPEQVIQLMVEQIWRFAKKHRDVRIAPADWHAWWEKDATCRNALAAFVVQPEDQRGLPTPDNWRNVDYAKDAGLVVKDSDTCSTSLLSPTRASAARFNQTEEDLVKSTTDMNSMLAQPIVDYEDLIQKGQTESPFFASPTEVEKLEISHSAPPIAASQ